MHTPEWCCVPGCDLVLEGGLVGEDFRAIEASDEEGFGESGFGD
jgi:hypothetical protein